MEELITLESEKMNKNHRPTTAGGNIDETNRMSHQGFKEQRHLTLM